STSKALPMFGGPYGRLRPLYPASLPIPRPTHNIRFGRTSAVCTWRTRSLTLDKPSPCRQRRLGTRECCLPIRSRDESPSLPEANGYGTMLRPLMVYSILRIELV